MFGCVWLHLRFAFVYEKEETFEILWEFLILMQNFGCNLTNFENLCGN